MKQSANGEYADAFCVTCYSYQLDPVFVLQTFADAVSVHGFLDPNAELATYLASKIFSGFSKDYRPVLPLDPLKRDTAIQNIRRILKILQSLAPGEQKQAAFLEITESWFKTNRIQAAGTELCLDNKVSITLPKGLLLQCDMFRCPPQDLLYYFMGLVVLETKEANTTGPAIEFLLYCAGLVYPVENN
jgi:hypothetical protein